LVLTLVVFVVARAVPVPGRHPLRTLGLHLGAGTGLTVLGVALQQGLLRALRPDYATRLPYEEGVQAVLRDRGALFLMLYTGLVGIYHAVEGTDGPTSEEEDGGEEDHRPAASAKPATEPDRLLVRTGDALVPVPIDAIEWIEAADSYVRLHRRNGSTHLHRASMTEMAERLADHGFLRVHRSTIVRVAAIERVETPAANDHYAVALRDGTRRRVSRRYRDALLDALGAST
jgi:two-component system LytT family response regulator